MYIHNLFIHVAGFNKICFLFFRLALGALCDVATVLREQMYQPFLTKLGGVVLRFTTTAPECNMTRLLWP